MLLFYVHDSVDWSPVTKINYLGINKVFLPLLLLLLLLLLVSLLLLLLLYSPFWRSISSGFQFGIHHSLNVKGVKSHFPHYH